MPRTGGAVILMAALTVSCSKGLRAGTGPTPASTRNMTFSFEKACDDGRTTYVKVFDRDNGDIWPSAGSSWTLRYAHSTHRDQSVHAIVITGTTAS